MAQPYQFDYAYFIGLFTEFNDPLAYPSSVLAGYWTLAESGYLPSTDQCILNGTALVTCLNLMTAHLAKSFSQANSGKPGVVLTGATQGTVSASMAPAPFTNGYQYWLSTTPYGAQLWALLQVRSAGGIYVGGTLDRASFRRAGGRF